MVTLFLPASLASVALALAAPAGQDDAEVAWNARNVEHLYNRAAFGATTEEIDAALERSPEEVLDALMTARVDWERVEPVLIRWEDFDLDPNGIPVPKEESKYKDVPRKEMFQRMSELRGIDRTQFMNYTDEWFRSMIDGDDPVRDRMTLFWHGFFTTASPVVKRKFELMNQHQFLRENALGNFKDLLHGIVRDPAMLQYLDGNTNVKEHPNENLARELMELYSLGEGNYTEVDVREAARALTGCHANPEGRYEFKPEHHDDGEKTVLGVTGKLKDEELVDIILAQEACPRWVSYKILLYLEGTEPGEERVAEYAAFLREEDYEIQPFLEKLFLDPEFYRDEIVGARVQGPIDYMIGVCHKLDLEPREYALFKLTNVLGQEFYNPPSVKGWDGGETWITNNLLMQRGNCAGVLLGTLPIAAVPELKDAGAEGAMGDDMDAMMELEERARGEAVEALNLMARVDGWDRGIDLVAVVARSNAASDEEIVDAVLVQWLAIDPPDYLRENMLAHLERERVVFEVGEAPLLESPDAEVILRRLAHLILSLPEAQLG